MQYTRTQIEHSVADNHPHAHVLDRARRDHTTMFACASVCVCASCESFVQTATHSRTLRAFTRRTWTILFYGNQPVCNFTNPTETLARSFATDETMIAKQFLAAPKPNGSRCHSFADFLLTGCQFTEPIWMQHYTADARRLSRFKDCLDLAWFQAQIKCRPFSIHYYFRWLSSVVAYVCSFV